MDQSVALTKKGKQRLVEYLQLHQRAIQAVMDRPIDQGRIIFALENAIRRNFQVAGCTTMSVFNALATCYRDGLEIASGEAYLVPFRQSNQNICTLVYDYRGLIKIAKQARVIHYMVPVLVREKDRVEWDGDGGLIHIPAPVEDADTVDDVVFGFCRTLLVSDQSPQGLRMPVSPVWKSKLDKIFKVATAKMKRNDGPWFAWKPEMYLKSIIKQEFKQVPRTSHGVSQAIDTDTRYDYGSAIEQVIDVDPVAGGGDDPIEERAAQMLEAAEDNDMPKRKEVPEVPQELQDLRKKQKT